MSYEQFLEKLSRFGFDVVGLSYAFYEFDKWEISFIRFGGKYQNEGKISFVICAKPTNTKGLNEKIVKKSRNPNEYPLKLVLSEIEGKLVYKSKLLNFSLEELDREADWSTVYEKLSISLPKLLLEFGIDELKQQISSQKELGFIEKIWLEN